MHRDVTYQVEDEVKFFVSVRKKRKVLNFCVVDLDHTLFFKNWGK